MCPNGSRWGSNECYMHVSLDCVGMRGHQNVAKRSGESVSAIHRHKTEHTRSRPRSFQRYNLSGKSAHCTCDPHESVGMPCRQIEEPEPCARESLIQHRMSSCKPPTASIALQHSRPDTRRCYICETREHAGMLVHRTRAAAPIASVTGCLRRCPNCMF